MAGAPPSEGVPALTAAEIAVLVGGTLHGDGSCVVSGVAPLDRATGAQLSFLADKRYAHLLPASQAGVVLCAPDFADTECGAAARIVVPKPHDALVQLLPRFFTPAPRIAGVHPAAFVSPTARIAASATIDAGAVIGHAVVVGERSWVGAHCVVADGVVIGDDCRLVAQVTCYSGTVLGNRVTVHAGTRLGSDGFGYAFAKGAHQKIQHVGRCVIDDDVEIGANTTIDRGSIDDTVIGAGTKIDNLVHIAHNVRIGRLCLLMAQVGVAGSTRVEDGAVLAGQAGVAGHVHIGAGARVAAQAGVIGDVPAGETWSGYPARPHKEAMRASAALFKLSGLLRRIERMLDPDE